jgi:hypothetical protein
MAEKPKYEPDDEAQSKRFEDTARSHGADDPAALERALGVIVKKPTNDAPA